MAQMTKDVHIDSVRQIYNDGNHNAFTDLCWFKDRLYLAFRSCPDGHMLFTTSRIVILSSEDAKSWTMVHSFNVPNRDVRDPHFLVFQGKLFVYSGTWLVDPKDPYKRNIDEQQGYCVWSEDGAAWHGPTMLEGTSGYYVWRAAAYGNVAYLNGNRAQIQNPPSPLDRDEKRIVESWLMHSRDGFNWRPVGRIQAYGNETAFLFEDDGSILAIVRGDADRAARVCRARYPYREWTSKDLDRNIGGPMLVRWEGHYLVGGRKTIDKHRPTTTLYWLVDDQLEEILELPSGGDNSYPGFVQLAPGTGLLSYYSSHEGSGTSLAPSAIYLAELSLG